MRTNQRPRTGWLRNRRVVGLAAVLVGTAVASGAIAWAVTGSSSDHHATPEPTPTATAGDQFSNAVLTDFANMSTGVISYLKSLQEWRADKTDDASMATVAKTMLADVAATQKALAIRQPFPQAPRALEDYRRSADLYAQSAALVEAATAVPRGDLRTQLQLATNRAQTLADRVFDQGRAEMKPFLTPEREFPGVVQVQKANEVPNFAATALAAGPPLVRVSTDTRPRDYQDTRPEQSLEQWLRLVQSAGVPGGAEEESAIDAGRKAALADMSMRFTHASDLLYDKPDPSGERIVNTRIQLALLIQAEATQAGQAATLVPAAQHDRVLHVAQTLALIADKLWDDRLGPRTSHYSDALLTVTV